MKIQRLTLIWQSLALFLCLLVFSFAPNAAQLMSKQSEAIDIIVSVPKNFPPHYVLDQSGNISGFSIDVIDKIAELANLRLTYLVRDSWKEVQQDLLDGKVDAIANLGISPQRLVYFDFTRPLETSSISIFVRQSTSSIQNIYGLSGQRIAVVESSVAVSLLNDRSDIIQVVYVDVINALFALLSGEVDALVYPQTVLHKLALTSGVLNQIKTVGDPLLEIKRAIAIKKGNEPLLARLNKAVTHFIASDSYHQIYTKWYGQKQIFWTVAQVGRLMLGIVLSVLILMFIWRYLLSIRSNRELSSNLQQLKKIQEKLRLSNKIVENSPAILFRWKAVEGWPVVYVSKNIVHFGYTPGQFVSGQLAYKYFIHKDDRDRVVKEVKQFSDRGHCHFSQQYRVVCANGDTRWTDDSTWIERDSEGIIQYYEGFIIDITDKKIAEDKLRLSSSVFANASEGILITDKDNRIVDINPSCQRITGYTKQELLGKNPKIFGSEKQDENLHRQMWKMLTEEGNWQGEAWNRRKSGQIYPVRLSINKVFDKKGDLQNYVTVFYDNTYIKEHENVLKHIAYNDSLTELPNRLLLRDRVQQALIKAERHQKLIAVCYLDLDGFKPVNDRYGHNAGDQVLIEVAKRLKEAVREGDTVSRFGGDEFVLLMNDLTDIGEIEQVVERILVAISKPYELSETINSVSASIGIAHYPPEALDADTLLGKADKAMYVAKQKGKNQYCFSRDLTEDDTSLH